MAAAGLPQDGMVNFTRLPSQPTHKRGRSFKSDNPLLADPATAPRQATVRFDVPSSPGRGAGVAPPGVLHVPPSLDEREERLLPYR